MIPYKKCAECGKDFYKKVNVSRKSWETTKFCSRPCTNAHMVGKPSQSPGTTFKKGESFLDKIQHRDDCKCRRCIPRKGEQNNKWKGGDIEKTCSLCQKTFHVERYREKTAKFCSRECVQAHRQSEEYREDMSKKHKQRVEDGLHNLYCGATEANALIRQSSKYKIWRTKVFQRDDYTCQECGQKGGRLNADHIKQFAYYPELRFEVDNGRTLCLTCHQKTESWGRRLVYR